jgi:hypothetical protein
MGSHGLDCSGSGYGQLVGICEIGNEHSPQNAENFLTDVFSGRFQEVR